MARAFLGRSIRRLRAERGLTQSVLASRLGISPSYLNLIEHDARPVTASLLIKLSRLFDVGIDDLSGEDDANAVLALREALTDPELGPELGPEPGSHHVSDAALAAIADHNDATRAILALSRALAAARDEAAGMRLPSGRQIRLPWEEARATFRDHGNHFPVLEQAAETIRHHLGQGTPLPPPNMPPPDLQEAMVACLRADHGTIVRVLPLEGVLRDYDPASRILTLSDLLRRESRCFQLAVQLVLLRAREAIEALITEIDPTTPEATGLIRLGLVNYTAAALLMPYDPFLAEARTLRHDVDLLAARFSVSFEQAAQRLSSLQASGNRGIPFFFVRTDAAGNMTKIFANAGFPFSQRSASCPLWVANTAFAGSDQITPQIALLPGGARFLCFARAVTGPSTGWAEPPPTHTITLGCDIAHAADIVYADALNLDHANTRVGPGCRLCDWLDCRSRAFPPLHHRLELDINQRLASPLFPTARGRK